VSAVGVDELLDQVAAELAPDVDVDDLVLEILHRLIVRRARDLLLGDGKLALMAETSRPPALIPAGEASSKRGEPRFCRRCGLRPSDSGFKTCGDCRRWAREYRRRLRARAAASGRSASDQGVTEPVRSEVELAVAGARGPRAAEIAQGFRDPNALAL